jgi:tetratricopeptide (TPR) repeat protein
MHERSRGHLAEATRAAQRAVKIARRARLRGELLKSLGTQGLVLIARGREEAALAPLEEALALTLERTPRDAARSRAYLVEALGHLGRMEPARAHAEAALAECADDGERGRAKEAWVRTSLGAAFAFAEGWSDTRAALDHPTVHEAIARDPLPGLLARRWLGLALCRSGETARGTSLLTTGAFAYGDALEPSLRFAADVNTLHELAERARRGELDEALCRDAIARVASFEAAHVLLAKRLAAAERSLASAPRAARALHALALDAGRLA